MYAKHRIGVIVPVLKDHGGLWSHIASIPSYVDMIYVLGNGANGSDFYRNMEDEMRRNPRIRYVKYGHDDSRDIGMNLACKRALDDGMDITAVLEHDRRVNLSYLSSLLDPIVWGRADYTKGQQNGHSKSAEHHRSTHFIQHSRMTSSSLRQIDPFRGCVAFSKYAMSQLYDHFALLGEKRILAVIPCYNEEVSIGSVVLKARKYVDEVLVVDDGSTDATARVARDAGATVITHEVNQGKAKGVFTGLRYALDNQFDFMVLLDGDGQHDPEEIPRIAAPVLVGRADLIIGSRFLQKSGSIPLYRRIGQTILTYATNANSTVKITDSQSGYRVLSRRAMQALTIKSDGYNIESDMIAHLSREGVVIREVPIKAIYEVPHKHKKNPVYHGYDVLANIVGEIGYKRPLLMFGITGFVSTFIGLVAGFFSLQAYLVTNQLPFGPTLVGGIGLILGMILLSSGFILNSLVVMHGKPIHL